MHVFMVSITVIQMLPVSLKKVARMVVVVILVLRETDNKIVLVSFTVSWQRMLFSSYCKHAPNFVLQIHVILVSVAVVQILCVCTEVIVITNVPVIQASLEMEKSGVLVSFTLCFVVTLSHKPDPHKLNWTSLVNCVPSVIQSHCSIIHMTRHTTDNSKKPGHLFHQFRNCKNTASRKHAYFAAHNLSSLTRLVYTVHQTHLFMQKWTWAPGL